MNNKSDVQVPILVLTMEQIQMLLVREIKVAIADDHDFLREALRLYLESFPDVECVGEASDGGEADQANVAVDAFRAAWPQLGNAALHSADIPHRS